MPSKAAGETPTHQLCSLIFLPGNSPCVDPGSSLPSPTWADALGSDGLAMPGGLASNLWDFDQKFQGVWLRFFFFSEVTKDILDVSNSISVLLQSPQGLLDFTNPNPRPEKCRYGESLHSQLLGRKMRLRKGGITQQMAPRGSERVEDIRKSLPTASPISRSM